MKRLNLALEDQVYNELREVKERLGLTWEKLLIEGARCLKERLQASQRQ